MRSRDSVRDAAGSYVQYRVEYKIVGRCVRRRGSQLCQWSGGVSWGLIWFSVLGNMESIERHE